MSVQSEVLFNRNPFLIVSLSDMSSSRSLHEEDSTLPSPISRQRGLELTAKIRLIPEGGWGWVICAAAFVTQFIVMGVHNSFGILYTTLLEEYKKSKAETGEGIRTPCHLFAND